MTQETEPDPTEADLKELAVPLEGEQVLTSLFLGAWRSHV
jgi:hypothetical protein